MTSVRAAPAITAAAAVAVLVAACSGTEPGGSSGAGGVANSSQSGVLPALAFARCMRSHGVPGFSDPNSSGREPPSAKLQALTNPRFPAAARACAHLLPNGGSETHAQIVADQRSAVRFAACMRSDGVPNWPDPTLDADGRPVFAPQAAGIDLNAPQVGAVVQRCQSLLHLAQLPQGA